MTDYSEFYHDYNHVFNIFIVYIMEAHVTEVNSDGSIDGWPIGTDYALPQTKTLDERISNAVSLANEFNVPIPMYIDSMTNDFNTKYKAWPDMFYHVNIDKQINYIGSLGRNGTRSETFSTSFKMTFLDKIDSLKIDDIKNDLSRLRDGNS